MASSSSSTAPQVQHDVFLSFRGEDTRHNFTSYLYAALCDKKIDTFIDDQLKRGDQISQALLKTIQGSKISLVIFSEGYASSRWCLDELAEIFECRSNYGQVVTPVFYGVDPSDVRKQTGAFGNGFAEVKERKPEKLQKWRDVLKEAANLSGFDSNVIRPESVLIENIVDHVLKILNDESTLIDNKNLFGIDSRIEHIENLLRNKRMIGIWGIGGIGKTTLARAVFNKIASQFQGSYFIPNIREESKIKKGLIGLRQKLFHAILGDKYQSSPYQSSPYTRRLICRKKLLIVFDDVTHVQQIESLIENLYYLSFESRIIITTRDKLVLKICEVDDIYETEALSHDVALQLFSQYAFNQDSPKEDFMQLSSKVLTYAEGIPLALKVLGLFLFKRTKQDWESAINRFKRIPHQEIQKVLKVSYDGLNYEEQNIFLDIAFFFKGCNRDLIEKKLDARHFFTREGVDVLIEKSLIIESNNTITMHNLLQQMAREIVRQESLDDPGKHSRLLHHSVLMENMGNGAILDKRLHNSEVGEVHSSSSSTAPQVTDDVFLSSSSSSTAPQVQYDVYLSFRGIDTRNNFVSHLYAALCGKKIYTFTDNQLSRGDPIYPALLKAIERSKIFVVIFSKCYASSRWCLEELEMILERRSSYGKVVIPVFYRVDPSDVRHQTGAFGNGFAKVKESFNGEPEKLEKWRDVLKEAAGLSGFDSNVIRPESALREAIVKDIWERLDDESSLVYNKNLVGIDSRIEHIESLLCGGVVRKIGFWGIGGIGKTTLARAIFNKIYRQFEGYYFIQNIREELEKGKRLIDLRQDLVSTLLSEKYANLDCTFTRRRLGRTKVLIVFDDVTELGQIESLFGDFDCLSSESRIIITTRDKQVLKNCKVDYIYETEGLSDHESFQLFSQYAFGQNHLIPKDFMQLSRWVLTYVKGVPLAIKVLGSLLFKKTKKQEWESIINKLKQIPPMDIQKVFKVSYDRLNDEEQNIFLDITFFFNGCNRDLIEDILNNRGFDAHIGINVLIEKSLVTESFNTITTHDLLQEMGKEVVRQESPNDPGKRSRLWHYEDIYLVLTKNMGTSAIRGICLHMSKLGEIHLNPTAFSNMHNLRFLQVYSSGSEDDNKVHGFELVESDFSELRYLFWSGYSAKSLPPNFRPKSLVALDMQFSKLKHLLLGGQDLVNLKHINLRNSNNLVRILDLSRTPNLESLILEGCTSLNESLSSIEILSELVALNHKGCVIFNILPRSRRRRRLNPIENSESLLDFDTRVKPGVGKILGAFFMVCCIVVLVSCIMVQWFNGF